MLMSPFHHVRKHLARRRQLRTVLHMLSASGVIRPSHIEPRYFAPSSQVDALYRHGTIPASTPSTRRPSVSRPRSLFDATKFRRFLSIKPSDLQIEQ